MKIPEETENSTDLSPDNTNENVNKTDRFARLLKKKEMELKKRPKFALPREKMLTKPACCGWKAVWSCYRTRAPSSTCLTPATAGSPTIGRVHRGIARCRGRRQNQAHFGM